MTTTQFVHDALRWAFKTFADNLHLFLKLLLLSFGVTIAAIILTLGTAVIVISFYVTLCFINVALKLYDGHKIESIDEFWVGGKPWAKSLIATCLYSLLVGLGLIFLIIPGLYIASRYYYIVYCIMSDDVGIIEAFTCSYRLTDRLPWHGLLLLVCATICGAVWFLIPVAALMNVYAFKYCKKYEHVTMHS